MTKAHKKFVHMILFHLIICGIGFIMIYPLIWMGFSSFKESSLVLTTVEQLLPKEWRIDNYANGWAGFGGTTFSTFFKNSIVVTCISVVGNVIASAMAAYGFARIPFKGRNVFFICMMITLMIPSQVLVVPQYIIFNKLGWVNSFLPLTVPEWGGRAFFIFLIMQFISGIPKELDEAAEIDGCGRIGTLFRVLVPVVKPTIVTASIFAFYWIWQDFFQPLIFMSTTDKFTISLALNMYLDPNSYNNYGGLFAMSVTSLLPVIIFFIVFQRYLVEGIAMDGIKG